MTSAFIDLAINLKGGIRLCLFRRLGPDSFRVSADQLVLLFLVGIALSISIDYLNSLPNPEFNTYAVTSEGFSAAVLLLSAYLIARFLLRRQVAIALAVLILSATPPILLVWQLAQVMFIEQTGNTSTYWWTSGIYLFWVLAVVFWCIRTIAGSISKRVAVSFAAMLFTCVAPVWFFAANYSYWYPGDDDQAPDPYQAYRDLNAERILFSQSALLNREFQSLKPGREGIVDVYFVGVGAYATQDVFLKETLFAKDLFERRFDAEGRSIALINHLKTRQDIPLATATNLEESLRYIGSVMNKDEDVLVLYMTSHGSASHEFSVNFWPLPLNDITPDMLRRYLDNSGIKWRVVMVSACYSGGFIEPLKTPFSAIATAAAPDRMSFGCSNENDFTYYGEALLKDQLQKVYSLPVAFSNAKAAIAARESKENLTASNPQFVIGDEIRPVLEGLTSELQALGSL